MAKALALAACALALSGCAAVGVATGTETEAAPEDRLAGYTRPGTSTVRVTRVSRFGGAACSVTLFVGNEAVAHLWPGRFATFAVQPGELLRAHYAFKGICPAHVTSHTLQLAPGAQAQFVFDISHHGQIVLERAQ